MRLENRIEVHDHCEAGKYIIEWTLGERTCPHDLEEFKKQLDGIVTVPDDYKTLRFVQSKNGELVIRLPEERLLKQSRDRARALDQRNASRMSLNSVYEPPRFYDDLYNGTGAARTIEELLQCRIGDYTIASCK